MNLVTEALHRRRLESKQVRIVTGFHDEGTYKQRSSDRSLAADIRNGIIIDKAYYIKDEPAVYQTEYNPGITFSYQEPTDAGEHWFCPICGAAISAAEAADGCPWCGSFYNIDYKMKVESSRLHSDFVLQKKKTMIPMVCGAFSICFAVVLLLVLSRARTHGVFDVMKGSAFGAIAGIAAAYAIYWIYGERLTAAEIAKEKQQAAHLQAFLRGIKTANLAPAMVYNAVTVALNALFYGNTDAAYENIIDYDILDYTEHEITAEDLPQITLLVFLRLVYDRNGKITFQNTSCRIKMRKNPQFKPLEHAGRINILHCGNCGASVNVLQKNCPYCGTELVYSAPFEMKTIDWTD